MSGTFRVEQVLVTGSSEWCRVTPAKPAVTNCWLVGDDTEVVVVDAAGGPEEIAAAVGDRVVVAVICTHGSASHFAAAVDVAYGLYTPVLLHPADHVLWERFHGDHRYWRLDDGQRIAVAGEEIQVLHTPFPTAGAVSLYIPRPGALLTGDALEQRRQADGRSRRRVLTSADEALRGLPFDTRVHPGHGDCFALGHVLHSPADRFVERSA
ncbi:MBL fold metallo-hydrolase [Prescottella agglutinans]|uniref:Glyoxylase-like metal-dependent hydrolase (Beta-lactamase superfamily II) n=1 Tax=Prescottella agglutinans TaxID=1644129 RepID=A0ABT6M7S8_9NOCA|nr:MBL fold metallo-hydrolase [Prescottella agglutinans]MDH6280361.1 glyoxylase-like metal-dependent hydrolase (beta-lactamase superfamily II) [Prescottella agglutinans]